MATYDAVIPLTYDDSTGVAMHATLLENVKQGLKNLILTNPGERIDLNYGVGLRRYLFENITDDTLSAIKTRIISQIDKYAPYVNITTVEVKQSALLPDNGIVVSIHFSVARSAETFLTVST
jgi:phage baseplate assembly protein W